MRHIVILVGLLGASSVSCGSSEQPAPTGASAEVKATAGGGEKAQVKALARIGGSVVAAGDHSVELLVYQRGLIEAVVSGADGKLVDGSGGAKLNVTAQAEGNAKSQIALEWAPERARFVGKAKAGVKLVPGPVDVTLALGEKTLSGKLAEVAVLVGPEFGGTLVAAGKYSAELRVAADGDVEAHIRDAAGVELKADAGVSAKVKLQAEGGKTAQVALAWNAPRAAFVGRAEAGLVFLPGPLELSIEGKGSGRLEAIALIGVAAHGGRVIVAGDYSVELVAGAGGALHAYVMDARGKAYAKGDLALKLEIDGRPIKLEWDAPSLSFKGKLAAGLKLDVQPIELSLTAGGRLHAGAQLSAKASLDARAAADVKADANLAAKGDAKAGAKLAVTPPKLDAKANLKKTASVSAKTSVSAPKVEVKRSASAGAKAGFSFGTK